MLGPEVTTDETNQQITQLVGCSVDKDFSDLRNAVSDKLTSLTVATKDKPLSASAKVSADRNLENMQKLQLKVLNFERVAISLLESKKGKAKEDITTGIYIELLGQGETRSNSLSEVLKANPNLSADLKMSNKDITNAFNGDLSKSLQKQ